MGVTDGFTTIRLSTDIAGEWTSLCVLEQVLFQVTLTLEPHTAVLTGIGSLTGVFAHVSL